MHPSLVLHVLVRPPATDIIEDMQSSFMPLAAWQDKPGGLSMVDYMSNIISGLHWPAHAAGLDRAVYPGLAELLPLIKNVDCFRELCVVSRWPEGEPALNEIPDAATLRFDQKTGMPS